MGTLLLRKLTKQNSKIQETNLQVKSYQKRKEIK
jgi:hypothetical protein